MVLFVSGWSVTKWDYTANITRVYSILLNCDSVACYNFLHCIIKSRSLTKVSLVTNSIVMKITLSNLRYLESIAKYRINMSIRQYKLEGYRSFPLVSSGNCSIAQSKWIFLRVYSQTNCCVKKSTAEWWVIHCRMWGQVRIAKSIRLECFVMGTIGLQRAYPMSVSSESISWYNSSWHSNKQPTTLMRMITACERWNSAQDSITSNQI